LVRLRIAEYQGLAAAPTQFDGLVEDETLKLVDAQYAIRRLHRKSTLKKEMLQAPISSVRMEKSSRRKKLLTSPSNILIEPSLCEHV
jgi:hypothetical protein